jgi:hypothetical protein
MTTGWDLLPVPGVRAFFSVIAIARSFIPDNQEHEQHILYLLEKQ